MAIVRIYGRIDKMAFIGGDGDWAFCEKHNRELMRKDGNGEYYCYDCENEDKGKIT